jgi:hypothetical protein
MRNSCAAGAGIGLTNAASATIPAINSQTLLAVT